MSVFDLCQRTYQKYRKQQLDQFLQEKSPPTPAETITSALHRLSDAAPLDPKTALASGQRVTSALRSFLGPSSGAAFLHHNTPPTPAQAAASAFRHVSNSISGAALRRQHLEEMLPAEEQQRRKQLQTQLNRELAVGFFSLGSAIAGALVYAPIGLFSLTGWGMSLFHVYKQIYVDLFKKRQLRAEVIIAIGTTTLYATGWYVIGSLSYVLYLLGEKLMRTIVDDTEHQLYEVFRMQPRFVWAVVDGSEVEIPYETVSPGDIVVVHAGETIPVDGTIIEGFAVIDQHILTGEAQPIEKEAGAPVLAGTVVLAGIIQVLVRAAGDDTTAAHIGQVLNQTRSYKTSRHLHLERLSDDLVVPFLALGALCFPFVGPLRAIAITFSHPKRAGRLSLGISLMNFLNMASQQGGLVKDGRSFELLSEIDTLVFDKTGTLTEEQPEVGEIHTCAGGTAEQLLYYAAAAEYKQTHPIAKAILQEASERGLTMPQVDEASYQVGYGLTVSLDGKRIQVGSARFMEMEGISVPPQIQQIQATCHRQAYSLVMVALNGTLIGAIELRPRVRQEAKQIIDALRQHHQIKSTYIVSGDHPTPTAQLANDLGIDHYFAEVLPEDKAEIIEQLQQAGKSVCFIGDGINDAIALQKAKVSISLRGASTIATDTAQIILMDGSLNPLIPLFDLARDCQVNMQSIQAAVLIPVALKLGGVLFLSFTLPYVVLSNQVVLFSTLGITMMPWLKQRGYVVESQANLQTQHSGRGEQRDIRVPLLGHPETASESTDRL